MADGKVFVEYSDRLKRTILGAEKSIDKQTSEFERRGKDSVFFDEEETVVSSDYKGSFDTSVSADSSIDGNVIVRVFNSSNTESTNAGIVYLGYETLNIAVLEKSIALTAGYVCQTFCWVYLNDNDQFIGVIKTTYDDDYDSNTHKSDDTHVRINISTVEKRQNGRIIIQRDRALDAIDVTGRWF